MGMHICTGSEIIDNERSFISSLETNRVVIKQLLRMLVYD